MKMLPADFHLEEIDATRVEKINNIYKIAFKKSRTKKQYEWEFMQAPGGHGRMFAVLLGQRIVSLYCYIPICCDDGESSFFSAKMDNAATHPDFRRRGLYRHTIKKMMTASYGGNIKMLWAFPVKYLLETHFSCGIHPMGTIARRVRVFKPDPIVDYFLSGRISSSLVSKGLKLAAMYTTPLVRKIFKDRNRFVQYIEPLMKARFDKRFDAFWKRVRCYYGITIARTSRYLNWRFCDNPNEDNVVFVVEKENKIQGYCVVKMKSISCAGKLLKVGLVNDFICENDSSVMASLLHKANCYFENNDCDIAVAWDPSCGGIKEKIRYHLKQSGFLRYPGGRFTMVGKILATEIDPIRTLDISNWYITKAFSEGV